MKAIVIMDHMLVNDLEVPTKRQLQSYGHNLIELHSRCSEVAMRVGSELPAIDDLPAIDGRIVRLLSNFARTTRYHNLDSLSAFEASNDPLQEWGEIFQTIFESDVPPKRRAKIMREASSVAAAIEDVTFTIMHGLDQKSLTTEEAIALPGVHDPAPSDRIRIIATITGFRDDFAEHPEWFRDGRGVPKWLDNEGGIFPEPVKDGVLACQIAVDGRFDSDSLEVETVRYFYDKDIDPFSDPTVVPLPFNLIRDLGFFLVPANRSWDRMLSFGSELFRRVVASAGGLPSDAILEERDRLRDATHSLANDRRLQPLLGEVNAEIEGIFGRSEELELRLTQTDSEGVLESLVPHFKTHDEHLIPSKRQGSGLISLQSLFLLFHFGQKRIDNGDSFFLALEEPELHLPPAVQRRVLSRLQRLSTQTIVTTHSPLVAAHCAPESLLVLEKTEGELQGRPFLEAPLDQNATNAIRKMYGVNRVNTTDAIMHEYLMVPEGRFDFEWLRLLSNLVELSEHQSDGLHNFGVRVGVISTSDARIEETCTALSACHTQIVALVDGDREGIGYRDKLRSQKNFQLNAILRWPNDWTIENVIGWIVQADESSVCHRLREELDQDPKDASDLVTLLQSKDRSSGGIKYDLVAHEIIASVLMDSRPCVGRAQALLDSLAMGCEGAPTSLFSDEKISEDMRCLVFVP